MVKKLQLSKITAHVAEKNWTKRELTKLSFMNFVNTQNLKELSYFLCENRVVVALDILSQYFVFVAP